MIKTGDLQNYIDFMNESHNPTEPIFTDLQIFQILCQMLESVSFMHLRKMAHRDIKPANFHSDSYAKIVYLTDFGCTKVVGVKGTGIRDTFDDGEVAPSTATYQSKTGTGGMGTIAFIPPEVLKVPREAG